MAVAVQSHGGLSKEARPSVIFNGHREYCAVPLTIVPGVIVSNLAVLNKLNARNKLTWWFPRSTPVCARINMIQNATTDRAGARPAMAKVG